MKEVKLQYGNLIGSAAMKDREICRLKTEIETLLDDNMNLVSMMEENGTRVKNKKLKVQVQDRKSVV